MTQRKQATRKLSLKKASVRVLTEQELGQGVGGMSPRPTQVPNSEDPNCTGTIARTINHNQGLRRRA